MNEGDKNKYNEMSKEEREVIADRQFKLLKGVRFEVSEYVKRFKPTDLELACYNSKYSWSNKQIN